MSKVPKKSAMRQFLKLSGWFSTLKNGLPKTFQLSVKFYNEIFFSLKLS